MENLMIKDINNNIYTPEKIAAIYNDSISAWKNDSISNSLKNYKYGDIKILKDDKKKIIYRDFFNERTLPLRKIKSLNPIDLFDFQGLVVNKKKFGKILETLPQELFMSTGKIVFLVSEKEITKALKRYDASDFSKESFCNNFLGVNMVSSNISLINAFKIKQDMLDYVNKLGTFVYEDIDYEFSQNLLITLFHELRHQMQTNLLFQEIFNDVNHEEDAEDFSMMLLEYIESKVDISFASF